MSVTGEGERKGEREREKIQIERVGVRYLRPVILRPAEQSRTIYSAITYCARAKSKTTILGIDKD